MGPSVPEDTRDLSPAVPLPEDLLEPLPESRSRSGRILRAPRALQDFLPTSTGGLPAHIPQSSIPAPPIAPTVLSTLDAASPSISAEHLESLEPEPSEPSLETDPNHFGVFRSYLRRPAREPDDESSLEQLCDHPLRPQTPPRAPGHSLSGFGRDSARQLASVSRSGPQDLSVTKYPWFYPFLNPSVFLLMEWTYTGSSMKSKTEVQRLVTNVINNDNFDPDELWDFDITKETARLDSDRLLVPNSGTETINGWSQVTVRVPAPRERVKHSSESDSPHFDINNVYLRRLLDVLKEAASDPDANTYNWTPYRLFWNRPLESSPPSLSHGTKYPNSEAPQRDSSPATERIRLFTDNMNCEEVNNEYHRMLDWAREHCHDPPEVEITIVPIAFYSDSTNLTAFGSASLWPIYAFFGFVSKYTQAKPSSCSAHHIAYVPKVCTVTSQSQLTDCIDSSQMNSRTGMRPPTVRLRPTRRSDSAGVRLCMPSGHFCSIPSSARHTWKVCFGSAATAFFVASSHDSSSIRLITPRSTYSAYHSSARYAHTHA